MANVAPKIRSGKKTFLAHLLIFRSELWITLGVGLFFAPHTILEVEKYGVLRKIFWGTLMLTRCLITFKEHIVDMCRVIRVIVKKRISALLSVCGNMGQNEA